MFNSASARRERLASLYRRFASSDGGATAILFGVMALPLLGIIAVSIDYGVALRTKGSLQRAADAAAYAGLERLPLGRKEVAKAVRVHLDANLPERLKGIEFELKTETDPPRVRVAVESVVETTMLAMIGYDKLPVAIEGYAELQIPRRAIELPPGLDETHRDLLSRNAPGLPPDAVSQAQRALQELGVGGGAGGLLQTPSAAEVHELQEMGRKAMRELERQGLGHLIR